jgi:hypothetical protein
MYTAEFENKYFTAYTALLRILALEMDSRSSPFSMRPVSVRAQNINA